MNFILKILDQIVYFGPNILVAVLDDFVDLKTDAELVASLEEPPPEPLDGSLLEAPQPGLLGADHGDHQVPEKALGDQGALDHLLFVLEEPDRVLPSHDIHHLSYYPT